MVKKIILIAAPVLFVVAILLYKRASGVPPTPAPLAPSGSAQEGKGGISDEELGLTELVQGQLPELFEIAKVDSESFGMGPGASLEKTKLLFPFQTYGFRIAEGVHLDKDEDVLSHIEPTGSWEVPVDWGDGSEALVHVNKSDTGWEVSGLGGRNTLISLKRALLALDLAEYLTSTQVRASTQVYFVVGGWPPIEIVIAQTSQGLMAVKLNSSTLEEASQTPTDSVSSAPDVFKSVFALP